MNTKLLTAIEVTRSEIEAITKDSLSRFSNKELLDIAETLTSHPEMSIAHFAMIRPKDTAAVLSLHYYNELFRRMEVRGMGE